MNVLEVTGDGVTVRVKVVPGASRTKLAGTLGDRLKLMVAAPPEGGKANRAVCELLTQVFDVTPRDVAVTHGHTSPQKTVTVAGLTLGAAAQRLNRAIKG